MADHSGTGSDPGHARGEELSALLDGELQGGPVERICSEWRIDARSRDTWHAYSLIGDVMRCEDLAHSCASDEQFLRDFRKRMAAEPVVLAPRAVPHSVDDSAGDAALPAVRTGRAWAWPAALAAGFVVVLGAVVGSSEPWREHKRFAANRGGALRQFRRRADESESVGSCSAGIGCLPRRHGVGVRRAGHSRSAPGPVPSGPQTVCRHFSAGADLGAVAQCRCRSP